VTRGAESGLPHRLVCSISREPQIRITSNLKRRSVYTMRTLCIFFVAKGGWGEQQQLKNHRKSEKRAVSRVLAGRRALWTPPITPLARRGTIVPNKPHFHYYEGKQKTLNCEYASTSRLNNTTTHWRFCWWVRALGGRLLGHCGIHNN
jgi:hypothetical protein